MIIIIHTKGWHQPPRGQQPNSHCKRPLLLCCLQIAAGVAQTVKCHSKLGHSIFPVTTFNWIRFPWITDSDSHIYCNADFKCGGGDAYIGSGDNLENTPFSSYPVTVKKLNGSEDVKLAGHEELDGQFPGERWHTMLTGPLVDFLQKLPGSLKTDIGVVTNLVMP